MKQNSGNKFVILPNKQTVLVCEGQLLMYHLPSHSIVKTWPLVSGEGILQFRTFDISADGKWLCLAGGYDNPEANHMTGIYSIETLLKDTILREGYAEGGHLFRRDTDTLSGSSPSSDEASIVRDDGEATLLVSAPTVSVFAAIVKYTSGKKSLVVMSRSHESLYLFSTNSWLIDTPYIACEDITTLAISNNGTTVTGGSRGTAYLWDKANLLARSYLQKLTFDSSVTAVTISYDSRFIVIGLANGNFSVLEYNMSSYTRLFQTTEIMTHPVQKIIFSPNAKNFVVINSIDIISIYSSTKLCETPRKYLLSKGAVLDIVWVDNHTLLITQEQRVVLLNIGRGIVFEKTNRVNVVSAKFLEEGKLLFVTQMTGKIAIEVEPVPLLVTS